MKTNEKELRPEESLRIIEQMIQRTKGTMNDNSFYFLLWGWIVLLADIGQIIISKFTQFEKPYLIWLIVIPGIIASAVYGMRQGKKNKVHSHLDRINFLIWMSFLISYTIVIIFMKEINYRIAPIIYLLVGNATFLTGIVIKFKPLVLGGIILWIGVILQFSLSFEYIDYISPVIITLGYLVPGYLLKSQNKKNA